MTRYVIVPIVEGHGEVRAVPVLVRRWLKHRNYLKYFDVDIEGPVRAAGKGALTVPHSAEDELGIEHYVSLAALREPDVILVLLDADDDCPKELGAELLERARKVVPAGFPIGVVVPNRMFESWFLAALASRKFRDELRARGLGASHDLCPRGGDPELIRDCKGRVGRILGAPYEETTHQQQFTEMLPFTPVMSRVSRSFRKLLSELESLLRSARMRR